MESTREAEATPAAPEAGALPTYRAEVASLARAYRLALPRVPLAGPAGRIAGSDLGASLDFQDFRSYFPGDDLRHVDWSIYARSDQLVVRLYREEVSPDLELVLDCSRSMASTPEKAEFALALAALFTSLVERERGRAALCLAGDRPARMTSREAEGALSRETFSGRTHLAAAFAAGGLRLRRRSVRVVISDFLFPHDPGPMVASFSRGAAAVFVVQALDRQELAPDFAGGHLLVDVETDEGANVLVDAAAVAGYRRRLDALTSGLARQCRLWGAPFARVAAPGGGGARGLGRLCREELVPAGILAAG